LQSAEDEFPYHSDDPNLLPPTGKSAVQAYDAPGDQDLKILLRLLIGTALEGSDEFRRRTRHWQAQIRYFEPSKMEISLGAETSALHLRYSLIGFLFQAIDTGHNTFSSLGKASSRAYSSLSRMFAPLTKSRFWRPVQNNFDNYAAVGEAIVNSWINIGRREELASRALARQQAYEGIINDIIDYLADKPEVRDLVQQQSVGLAEEFVEEIRDRSTEFDSLLEERVNRLLGRQKNV